MCNFAEKVIMNKLFTILVATALVGGMTSCGEKKKKTDVIIAHKPTAPAKVTTQKMSHDKQTRETTWVGSEYKVMVERTADTTRPALKIDDHTRYYDNKINVRILRQDGSEFFNRTFTKADFASCLDENTKEKGALLGIVFVKADNDQLDFAASVGSPDIASDEYVPMVLKISKMGKVSIALDTSLDTDGNEKASSEEDEA